MNNQVLTGNQKVAMYHRITIVFRARHGWLRLWRRRRLTWTTPNDLILVELESVFLRYSHQLHRLVCRPVEVV